jgi:hypothetical protein
MRQLRGTRTLLAEAIVAGLGEQGPLAVSLVDYRRRRDSASRPMYDFTRRLARLRRPALPDRLVLARCAAGRRRSSASSAYSPASRR